MNCAIRIVWRKLHLKIVASVLGAFSVLVLVPSSSFAINGTVYILPCDACNTVQDFQLEARNAALTNIATGTYVVTSRANPRSAYVTVDGTVRVICVPTTGDCNEVLIGTTATVIDQQGTAVTFDGDLNTIDDGLFGVSRSNELPPLQIDSQYATSFINSYDEEVIGGISRALDMKGINPGSLPIGSVVLVTFPDGTKAQYVKFCNCTDMWHWTGVAWNASGQRILRDGSVVANPNGSGNGYGSAVYSRIRNTDTLRLGGPDTLQWSCASWTTVTIQGTVVATYSTTVPC